MVRLFNVYLPASSVALLASESVLLFSCFVVAAALRLDVDLEVFFFHDAGLAATWVVVGSVLLCLYFQDLYSQVRVRSRLLLVQQVSLALGIACLTQAALNYVRPELMLPRWMMFIGCGIALVALPLWRMLFSSIVVTAINAQKVVFAGTNEIAIELARTFSRTPEIGFHCAGFLTEGNASGQSGERILGTLSDIKRVAQEVGADHVVVGLTERKTSLPADDLLELRVSGIPIEDAGSLYEATFGRVSVRELRPADLIFATGVRPNPSNLRLQSIYSWLIAAVLLIVTLPFMLILALLVKMTSKGPVLQRHTLVGKEDRPFTMFRFRIVDENQKMTPLGRWLRRFRLEALPQLFNVLRGDMSIVGPRPDRPEFARILEEKIPFYRQRTSVKPGATGWAQINLADQDSIAKMEYDLYYIKHLSFSLDIYIILSQIKSVLLGRAL